MDYHDLPLHWLILCKVTLTIANVLDDFIGHYTVARRLNRQYVRFYSRIVHSTNCSLLKRSKSHSKETQESKIMANVIGGISSSTAKNAVDQ